MSFLTVNLVNKLNSYKLIVNTLPNGQYALPVNMTGPDKCQKRMSCAGHSTFTRCKPFGKVTSCLLVYMG